MKKEKLLSNNTVSIISRKASAYLGTLSGILSFGLVLLISIDVAIRTLRLPLSGVLEISRLTLGWICFSSLVYTYLRGEHVRVTVFTQKMPRKLRTISEILGCALGAALMLSIFWVSVPFFLESWQVKEAFNTDVPLPYWLAKLSVPVGTFTFGLVYLIDLARGIFRIYLK